VKVSLGGIHDEAEIRGHRRTYVGALPGRIVQGLKTSKSCNPVMLLDEIDKIGKDFKGNPSAALLEILDPSQNSAFSDNYIEIPIDLSKVMFIATANNIYNIQRPLLDRLEVLHLSGYTEDEKFRILKLYQLDKQLKEHGLNKSLLQIKDEAIFTIIRYYTKEAGVRGLERIVAKLCRKAALFLLEGDKKKIVITSKNLQDYLGPSKYSYGVVDTKDQIGVATGLAWTETGGDIMPIEVSLLDGRGKLVLTGQLGDVMKESAQAAFSYVRSRSNILKIDPLFYEKKDLHIHIPEGAIPKDGPSAGIAIATAIVSALTLIPVSRFVAMTGEITLRGRILPIGGLKEKLLSALRAGITKVLIPKGNEGDLKFILNDIKDLKCILVEHMDQVLNQALVKKIYVSS